MAKPAEQLVDRHAEHLAAQVPERRLDAVDHDHAEPDARPEVRAVVHAAPQLGNRGHVEVLADKDRPEELDGGGHAFGKEVAGVGLAEADMLAVRVDLDVRGAAALAALAQVRVVGAGPRQEDRPDVRDLHGIPPLIARS